MWHSRFPRTSLKIASPRPLPFPIEALQSLAPNAGTAFCKGHDKPEKGDKPGKGDKEPLCFFFALAKLEVSARFSSESEFATGWFFFGCPNHTSIA